MFYSYYNRTYVRVNIQTDLHNALEVSLCKVNQATVMEGLLHWVTEIGFTGKIS